MDHVPKPFNATGSGPPRPLRLLTVREQLTNIPFHLRARAPLYPRSPQRRRLRATRPRTGALLPILVFLRLTLRFPRRQIRSWRIHRDHRRCTVCSYHESYVSLLECHTAKRSLDAEQRKEVFDEGIALVRDSQRIMGVHRKEQTATGFSHAISWSIVLLAETLGCALHSLDSKISGFLDVHAPPYAHWVERFDEHMRSSCLLYTSPSPRDGLLSRMPSSA